VSAPLAGRAALVTGVGRRRGIGFAIAKRLAAQGADLFVHAFTPYDTAQPWGADGDPAALLRELRVTGRRVERAEADFGDARAPAQLFEQARARLGPIDILVVNHAHSGSGALEELRADDIDRHLAVNVRASLLLVQAFAAQHQNPAGGRVILMISGPHRSAMPGELAYVASKGALHQSVRSLAAHLAPRGITVNAVNPGATDTGWASPELHASIRAQHPQGRWGEPDDAARLVAWLASDDARWITGQILDSTGGGP
jgi:3-oxoacyl-[acyl-carrier protein] reductase